MLKRGTIIKNLAIEHLPTVNCYGVVLEAEIHRTNVLWHHQIISTIMFCRKTAYNMTAGGAIPECLTGNSTTLCNQKNLTLNVWLEAQPSSKRAFKSIN